jgi:hypothetical protein
MSLKSYKKQIGAELKDQSTMPCPLMKSLCRLQRKAEFCMFINKSLTLRMRYSERLPMKYHGSLSDTSSISCLLERALCPFGSWPRCKGVISATRPNSWLHNGSSRDRQDLDTRPAATTIAYHHGLRLVHRGRDGGEDNKRTDIPISWTISSRPATKNTLSPSA